MKSLKNRLVFLTLITSLILSGCKDKNDEFIGDKGENYTDYTQEEVETNRFEVSKKDVDVNIVDELAEKKYAIKDLYAINRPDFKGNVTLTLARKIDYYDGCEESKEDKEFEYFETITGSKHTLCFEKEHILSCGKEVWLPDYAFMTITEASNYIDLLKLDYDGDTLTESQIDSLEQELNKSIYQYSEDHTYKIDNLLLVNSNGYFSLYSTERKLTYSTVNGNPIFYFFDINNYQNALRVIPDVKEEDFDGSIYFDNLLECEITSLDASYALSLKDVEHEFIMGNWHKGIYNGMSIQINDFSKYISDEQFERGYLTQGEVEDLVNSLNNEKTYSMTPNYDTMS